MLITGIFFTKLWLTIATFDELAESRSLNALPAMMRIPMVLKKSGLTRVERGATSARFVAPEFSVGESPDRLP
jgi:hypothetical protein